MSFSLHAMDVLEQREVSIKRVARVLEDPALVLMDDSDPHLFRSYGCVPEREGRVLRVVYDLESDGDLVWVITTFFARSMKGKL